MNFSDRFKELRKEAGFRQLDIAEKLGITDRAVRAYESGDAFPTVQGLTVLADLFNVTVDYLLGRDAVLTVDQVEEYAVMLSEPELHELLRRLNNVLFKKEHARKQLEKQIAEAPDSLTLDLSGLELSADKIEDEE